MVDRSTMRPRRWLVLAKMLAGKAERLARQQQAGASAASGGAQLIFVVPAVGIVPSVQAVCPVVVLSDQVCVLYWSILSLRLCGSK